MNFITYREDEIEKIGVLSKDKKRIIGLKTILGSNCPKTMSELIDSSNDPLIEKIRLYIEGAKLDDLIEIDKVIISAPIPKPKRSIICLGLNYREHVKESQSVSTANIKDGEPQFPIYFSKMANRIIGPNAEIEAHKEVTNEIDYEVELAVVISKDGKDIPAEKAEEYIFGYSIINDISARDLQRQHSQWVRGKSLDTFTAMGPYLVHKSEITFPVRLDLSSKVNGELRQNSNTKQFIFDIPYIISDLSKGMTLKSGDIIATGTPSGVGMGFSPPKYLKPGDVVECSIESLGTLGNRVR